MVEATTHPTRPQAEALRRMLSGGDLVRYPGGLWTTEETPLNGQQQPTWWVPVGTVRAMESRGWVARRSIVPESMAWEEPRTLTEAGRALTRGWVVPVYRSVNRPSDVARMEATEAALSSALEREREARAALERAQDQVRRARAAWAEARR